MNEVAEIVSPGEAAEARDRRQPLAVVVPCYNEWDSLDQLSRSLRGLEETFAASYDVEFLLVDDGSNDGTAARLEEMFGGKRGYRVLCHQRNLGIAAAIATGIAAAQAEIVCSIDADCTYDPVQLARLLPLLSADVDLVVASPYHPQGRVNNVPRWRLGISKFASLLYRLALRQKLHTYTSCFRVYRRRAVVDLQLANSGFVGIAELVWQLDRRGSRIVECPAVLDVRRTGVSKMRVLRAAFSHLRLLARALMARVAPWLFP